MVFQNQSNKGDQDESVSVCQCAAERAALYSVCPLQGVPRTAGVHCGRCVWRFCGRNTLVGGHGDQLARLGRGAFALRLPVHPQDPQVELIKQVP